MTRKHYIAIAAVIAEARKEASRTAFDVDGTAACSRIAHELASVLQSDNPRFDRSRFLTACGVQS